MQVKLHHASPTAVSLTVLAQPAELSSIKDHVLEHLGKDVKLAGFRLGAAPLAIVEKQVDARVLEKEFLDHAVSSLYSRAVSSEQLRPVAAPKIEIIKFVPFSTLEFKAELAVIGDIKLADYQSIKLTKPTFKLEPNEISQVIENLRTRVAEKTEVNRLAKTGDLVTISFSGYDPKSGEKIAGADGQDYPLILGSNNFIPGFEDQLTGQTKSQPITFPIVFPKDYHVKNMAGKKVNFNVEILKIEELKKPKIDDQLATKLGPFKKLQELEADIKKQLTAERQNQLDRSFENELVGRISANSTVPLPDSLIEEQTEQLLSELKQRLVSEGQTISEFYQSQSTKEADYRQNVLRKEAQERLKAGIILAEIADREKLGVDKVEVDERVAALKKQYTDQQMHEELDKPQARNDIAARILTEKTINRLVLLARNKASN